jgi:hypothetical protein
MCEECEEAEPLREAYLARRTRMAQTWRPKGPGRWFVDAPPAQDVSAAPPCACNAGLTLIAAE